MAANEIGKIGWIDLTVPDAVRIRDFYTALTGLKSEAVDMGEYEDFSLVQPGSGDAVMGVCHARGINEALPPVWMVYITVADLAESLESCRQLGGEVISGPIGDGPGSLAVIRDPAGAVCALMQQSE